MPDREKVIKAFETEIMDFTPACTSDERLKETMKMALELLKKEYPRCADCLHYHKGAHYEDGTEILDNVGYCALLERCFSGDMDYCSYHTEVSGDA